MPVRIYDISKKLGLENKEVLSKAKELGIAAARVASSSLDKITAEYLEQQLLLAHPDLVAPPKPAPTPARPHEPIVLVTATPATEVALKQETGTATATGLLEPPSEAASVSLPPIEAPHPVEPEPVAEAAPPPPPVPLGPKVGDKVGFIQLPTKPAAKAGEKPGSVKLPSRPVESRTTEFKRGDIRTVRSPYAPPGRPAAPSAKFPPAQQKGMAAPNAPEAPPAAPKIILPADAQV